MKRTIKIAALAAVTVVVGTAGAFADEYGYYGGAYRPVQYGDSYAWGPGPGYGPAPGWGAPPVYYRSYGGRGYGYYGNGANHPTPSSTQGDVGPGGNNNGTRSGYYRPW